MCSPRRAPQTYAGCYYLYEYFKGEIIALVDVATVPWRLIIDTFIYVLWAVLEITLFGF